MTLTGNGLIVVHENKNLDQLGLLGDKLNKVQEEAERKLEKAAPEQSIRSGLGFAMKIGVELISALIVGTGIGLLLDHWLGTTPWFMLLFFVLGSVAGIMNVYRSVNGFGNTIGFHPITDSKDNGYKKPLK